MPNSLNLLLDSSSSSVCEVEPEFFQRQRNEVEDHKMQAAHKAVDSATKTARLICTEEEEELGSEEEQEEDMYSEEYAFEEDSDVGEALRLARSVATDFKKGSPATYRSLSPRALRERMLEIIREATELLGVDEDVAAVLLRIYHWRLEDLLQEWFNNKSFVLKQARLPAREDVLEEEKAAVCGHQQLPHSIDSTEYDCMQQHQQQKNDPSKWNDGEAEKGEEISHARIGVSASLSHSGATSVLDNSAPCSASSVANEPIALASTDSAKVVEGSQSEQQTEAFFECPVTTLVVSLSETAALPCGHRFSNECWRLFLEAALQEDPETAVDKRCPHYKCGEVVRESFWRRFVSTSLLKRLEEFQVKVFVKRSDFLNWCPAPDCHYAVELLQHQQDSLPAPLYPPLHQKNQNKASTSLSFSPTTTSDDDGAAIAAASTALESTAAEGDKESMHAQKSAVLIGRENQSAAAFTTTEGAQKPPLLKPLTSRDDNGCCWSDSHKTNNPIKISTSTPISGTTTIIRSSNTTNILSNATTVISNTNSNTNSSKSQAFKNNVKPSIISRDRKTDDDSLSVQSLGTHISRKYNTSSRNTNSNNSSHTNSSTSLCTSSSSDSCSNRNSHTNSSSTSLRTSSCDSSSSSHTNSSSTSIRTSSCDSSSSHTNSSSTSIRTSSCDSNSSSSSPKAVAVVSWNCLDKSNEKDRYAGGDSGVVMVKNDRPVSESIGERRRSSSNSKSSNSSSSSISSSRNSDNKNSSNSKKSCNRNSSRNSSSRGRDGGKSVMVERNCSSKEGELCAENTSDRRRNRSSSNSSSTSDDDGVGVGEEGGGSSFLSAVSSNHTSSSRSSNSNNSSRRGSSLGAGRGSGCCVRRSFSGGDVSCFCGTRFCLYCGEEPHRPVRCEVIRNWSEKNESEADNVTWILVHTKNCPRCKQPIEKNQGCMHMTCRCGYEFCWLCLREWVKHLKGDVFRCNVFEQSPPDPGEEKRRRAKESLERYTHFFERYRAHSHGQRVAAEKQMRQVQRQMRFLLQGCLREVSEVEFLEAAVKQIVECRRILKWSYAFGYFADWQAQPHQKHLFEYHQYQLERNLDILQEKIEKFDALGFLEGSAQGGNNQCMQQKLQLFKAELTDLTRVVGVFFKNICSAFEHEFCN